MKRPLVVGSGLLVLVAGLMIGLTQLSALVGSAEAVDDVPRSASRLNDDPRVRGRIAFTAGGQIWEWADGAARALTQPGVRYEGPAWSPDGRWIAVSEVGENHSDVLVLDSSGKRLRQLTRHWSHSSVQESAWGRKPVWHPDGDRISYVSDLYGTDMSLWQVAAEGGQARRLYGLSLGSGGLDWPSWSPDGKRVVFAAYTHGFYQPPQLFVWTPATGAIAQITEMKDGAFDPAWSPDGAYIAFAGRVSGKTHVMIARPDGTELVRVTDGPWDRAPVWSPDSQEIAYIVGAHGSFDIAVVRFSSGAVSSPRELTQGKKVDAVSGLSWTR